MRDLVADLRDLGEDDVEHAEEHQRPHERPQVAQHRAEEAQLPLGDREREDERAEAARLVEPRRNAAAR